MTSKPKNYIFSLSILIPMLLNTHQYQDIIVNNTVLSTGVREFRQRYDALKPLLSKFKRPFTVLDIGAAQGAFGFSIAYDYRNSVITMIESDFLRKKRDTDELLDLCEKNTSLDNIIYMRKHISAYDLERLSQCEHFDVVLALNIVHHFGRNWKRALDAIFELGDHIVIEIPPTTDKMFKNNQMIKECNAILEKKGGTVLVHTPRQTDPSALSPMRLYHQKKTDLTRKYWFFPYHQSNPYNSYNVISTFDKKLFVKKTHNNHLIVRDWKSGINLVTFKMLNGQWPTKETIIESILAIKDASTHTDFFPWNMVLQGKKIETIDDEGDYNFDFNICLKKAIEFASLETPTKLEECFRKIISELSKFKTKKRPGK